MKFFILTGIFYLFGLLGLNAAFAQQNRMLGSWDVLTRMCMDNSKLVPLEGDSISIHFQANGTVTAQYIQGQESGRSYTDFVQEKWDHGEEYLEKELIKPHREVCRSGEPLSEELERECRNPRELYARWRSEMEERIRREIEEDRQRTIRETGLSPEEIENQVCIINFRGSYTVSGDNLTIEGTDTLGAGCGGTGSESQTMSGWYYFDERGRFYFVLPAYEPSREYCGNSEWAFILN